MQADTRHEANEPAARPAIGLGKAMVLLGFQAVGMVAIGGLLWRWSGQDASAFLTWSWSEIGQGVALGLALVALAFALFRGFPAIGERLVRLQAETYAFLGPRLGWPAIVFISLCAGVGEEALFRGGIQTFLAGQIGTPLAIAAASALFAALHLGKPVITALLLVVGAAFGAVYAWTGSLLTVMIGHALYDIWALKYLHGEFLRLGIVGEDAPPLANPAPEG